MEYIIHTIILIIGIVFLVITRLSKGKVGVVVICATFGGVLSASSVYQIICGLLGALIVSELIVALISCIAGVAIVTPCMLYVLQPHGETKIHLV